MIEYCFVFMVDKADYIFSDIHSILCIHLNEDEIAAK